MCLLPTNCIVIALKRQAHGLGLLCTRSRQIQKKKGSENGRNQKALLPYYFKFFVLRRDIVEHNFVNLSKYFKFYSDVQAVLCKWTMRQNVACQKYKTPFQYILHCQHNFSDYGVVLTWVT